VIAPPEDQPHFAEHLCLLPDCYMVTDDQQPIEARAVTRAEFNLPEQGFVFSSFNNGYKIEPVVFGAWMRILAAVPGSVLWLSALNVSIQHNLFAAAKEAGIEPTRLIFAPRVDKPLHIKRVGLAGLGLDTLVFNGHSTTADTLWGGTPVLTLRGRHFASRVTASLLTGVGLDECICSDVEQYVQTAIALAQDPARLAALRAMLVRNRIEQPLFHTRHFVRNLEAAYRAMWQRHVAGEAPDTLRITDAA
jgi:predicted O-linked N-acetylglucosamine transferase (SPINDLY family)